MNSTLLPLKTDQMADFRNNPDDEHIHHLYTHSELTITQVKKVRLCSELRNHIFHKKLCNECKNTAKKKVIPQNRDAATTCTSIGGTSYDTHNVHLATSTLGLQ